MSPQQPPRITSSLAPVLSGWSGSQSGSAEIWAATESLDFPSRMSLHPSLCSNFHWQEWGGQICGHGVSLMLGDLGARAMLCGKPEGHSPVLWNPVKAAAFGLGTRQGDVANVLDAQPTQSSKVEGYLLNSPNSTAGLPQCRGTGAASREVSDQLQHGNHRQYGAEPSLGLA